MRYSKRRSDDSSVGEIEDPWEIVDEEADATVAYVDTETMADALLDAMNRETQDVWFQYGSSPPQGHTEPSLSELNAFIRGTSFFSDLVGVDDYKQYDTIEEVREDFPFFEVKT